MYCLGGAIPLGFFGLSFAFPDSKVKSRAYSPIFVVIEVYHLSER